MDLMNLERFKRIIKVIQDFDKKKEKIDKFFEEEITENSYCTFTLGDELQVTLINILADEFDCWYSTTVGYKPTHWWKNGRTYSSSNDIEWWLYESDDTEEGKTIIVGDREFKVCTIEKFYDYLMEMYYIKKCNNKETEFSESEEVCPSPEESIEVLKNLFSSQI